jgi:hypothetical protein
MNGQPKVRGWRRFVARKNSAGTRLRVMLDDRFALVIDVCDGVAVWVEGHEP